MMRKNVLRSLSKDRSRAFFLFLTFALTTCFLFLFFNMSYTERASEPVYQVQGGMASATDVLKNGNISEILMGYVIIIAAIDMINANSFFVHNKAQELGVMLVCGASYGQLIVFLLLQTGILMSGAVVLGVLCGLTGMRIINGLLAGTVTVVIQPEAVLYFVVVLLSFLAWITILNVSFAYQTNAAALMNGDGVSEDYRLSTFGSLTSRVPSAFKGICGGILVTWSAVAAWKSSSSFLISGILGMIGMNLFIMNLFIPFLTSFIQKRGLHDPVRSASLGFLRQDLKTLQINILLLNGNAEVLIAFLSVRHSQFISVLLILICYLFMNILQVMSLMFRYQTLLSERNEEIGILCQTGYETGQILKSTGSELFRYFFLVTVSVLLFPVNAGLALMKQELIPSDAIVMILCGILIPLGCVWVITAVWYHRFVIRSIREQQLF